MYDFLLTEGDLKVLLATIERRRLASDLPYCLRLHIEPGQGNLKTVQAIIDVLSNEMIAEMRAKGQLDLDTLG